MTDLEHVFDPITIARPEVAAKLHILGGVEDEFTSEHERNALQSVQKWMTTNFNKGSMTTPREVFWMRTPCELVSSTSNKLMMINDGDLNFTQLKKITDLYSTENKSQGLDHCFGIGWKDVTLTQSDVIIVSSYNGKVGYVKVVFKDGMAQRVGLRDENGAIDYVHDVTHIYQETAVIKKYKLDTLYTGNWVKFIFLGTGNDQDKQDSFQLLATNKKTNKVDPDWLHKKLVTRFYNMPDNVVTKLDKGCYARRGNEESGRVTLHGIEHIINESQKHSKGNKNEKGELDEGFVITKAVGGIGITYGYSPTEEVRRKKNITQWGRNRSWPWSSTMSAIVLEGSDGIKEMFDIKMVSGTNLSGVTGSENLLAELDVKGQYNSFFVLVHLSSGYKMKYPHRDCVVNKDDTTQKPITLMSEEILSKIKQGIPAEWKKKAEEKKIKSKFDKDMAYAERIDKFFKKYKSSTEQKFELKKTEKGVHDYKKETSVNPNTPDRPDKPDDTPDTPDTPKVKKPRKKFKPYGNTFGPHGIDTTKIVKTPKVSVPKVVVCPTRQDAIDQTLIENPGKEDEKTFGHIYRKSLNTIFCNPFSKCYENISNTIFNNNKGFFRNSSVKETIAEISADELGKRCIAPILVARQDKTIKDPETFWDKARLTSYAESIFFEMYQTVEKVCRKDADDKSKAKSVPLPKNTLQVNAEAVLDSDNDARGTDTEQVSEGKDIGDTLAKAEAILGDNFKAAQSEVRDDGQTLAETIGKVRGNLKT